MPRKRSEDSIKAEEIYLEHKGNIELVEIAKKLDVSPGTVRSWKNRHDWDSKLDATLHNEKRNVANKPKRAKKKQSKRSKPEVSDENGLDIENPNLSEKHALFCLYYVKYWNATKAYQKVYECSYQVARARGSMLLAKDSIKGEIERLKQRIRDGVGFEVMALIQKYIDIVCADITDFADFGTEEITILDINGKPTKQKMNYVYLKDSSTIDGQLISEVKQGKDGASVKLIDKKWAMDKLDRYFDLLPDVYKRRIEEERLKLDKAKLGEEDQGGGDDGFIEALEGGVAEAWEDEDNEET